MASSRVERHPQSVEKRGGPVDPADNVLISGKPTNEAKRKPKKSKNLKKLIKTIKAVVTLQRFLRRKKLKKAKGKKNLVVDDDIQKEAEDAIAKISEEEKEVKVAAEEEEEEEEGHTEKERESHAEKDGEEGAAPQEYDVGVEETTETTEQDPSSVEGKVDDGHLAPVVETMESTQDINGLFTVIHESDKVKSKAEVGVIDKDNIKSVKDLTKLIKERDEETRKKNEELKVKHSAAAHFSEELTALRSPRS